MRLVDAGKLDLDAPVRTYLPEFRLADEDVAVRVTLRHVFTHTAGWLGDYFEHTSPSPFMMLVYKTRPEVRDKLCAINHVDNTGRLQTISRRQNPRYYALIEAFERQTGLPIVLNTSFNENEPIVCTPEEALACFLRTRMDLLVLGNYLVQRTQ